MPLEELLRESMATENLDCWERERTPTPVRAFGVRLHSIGLSLRETAAVLGVLGVERSHQVVFQWTHRLAEAAPDPPRCRPRRVAIDETAVQVGREWCWLYAAVDLDSKLLLGVRLSRWRGTRPASAFLRELKEQHELEETEFLVDAMGYRTALVRTDLGGRVEYRYRNLIENCSVSTI